MDKKEYIEFIHREVKDWLRFAEAKHIAFTVIVWYTINLVLSFKTSTKYETHLFFLCFMFLIVSLSISLYSLIPYFLSRRKNKKEKNIFFYFDIQELNFEEYKRAVDLVFDDIGEHQVVENMLLKEINNNSRIAVRKYNCFKLAVIFYMMSIVLLIGLILIIKVI